MARITASCIASPVWALHLAQGLPGRRVIVEVDLGIRIRRRRFPPKYEVVVRAGLVSPVAYRGRTGDSATSSQTVSWNAADARSPKYSGSSASVWLDLKRT